MALAYLIVGLAVASYAICDESTQDIHIDPEFANIRGDGSQWNPYQTIMQALDVVLDNTETLNLCIKLYQRETAFVLDSTLSNNDRFITFEINGNTPSLDFIAWDGMKQIPSTTNVEIQYRDPQIRWQLSREGTSMSFSYVTFTQNLLPDTTEWNSEICRHWHYADLLDSNDETGTGQNYKELEESWKEMLTLGTTLYRCTLFLQGPDASAGGITGTKYIDDDAGNIYHYGLFHVTARGAQLTMSNWKFSEWRFRPSYVINMSAGGSVTLTNVDFENVEPGKYGHEYQYTKGDKDYQKARGIITSFQFDESESGNMFDQDKECYFGDQNPYAADSTLMPKPCGTFTWNGGTVTGLNKDVNVKEQPNGSVQYYGFLDLRHLNRVNITDVTFEFNVIPIIYEEESNSLNNLGIVNIRYCSRIELTRWKFENNMAQMGAVFIEYEHDLWEYDTYAADGNERAVFNLYNKHPEAITIDNWDFIGNTQFSENYAAGLTIKSNSPINIEIMNCSFIGNNSLWSPKDGALLITAVGIGTNDYSAFDSGQNCREDESCYQNAYQEEIYSYVYWDTPKYLKLTTNVFKENKTGTTLFIENWVNVTLQDNEFTFNNIYDLSTSWTDDWSTIKKFVDTGRIRPNTGNSVGVSEDWNGYNIPRTLEWLFTIYINTCNGLNVIGNNTISNNWCYSGPIFYIRHLYDSLVFEDAIFSNNTCDSTKGCALNLNHMISYNIDTEHIIQIPEVKNSTFTDNYLYTLPNIENGACITGKNNDYLQNDKMRLKVTNWRFLRNTSPLGPAIMWPGGALIINNSTFEYNQNTLEGQSARSGTVSFIYTLDTSLSEKIIPGEFLVVNWTFSNNSGYYSPDINTSDAIAKYNNFLKLRIIDSQFTGTTAYQGIGSVQIGTHSFRQETDDDSSYIQSSTFRSINSEHGLGTLFIQHQSGAFTFIDVTFDGLISSQSSWGIYGEYQSDESMTSSHSTRTYVKIQDSTIQNCQWGFFIQIFDPLVKKHMITENLTVQNNYFNFAYVSYGYYTDTGSRFISNSADYDQSISGTIIHGTNRVQVQFTDSLFSNNSAGSEFGGAVAFSDHGTIVTFQNITAEGNTALKGGFLFASYDATVIIQDSTIVGNSAHKGGAIWFQTWNSAENLISNTVLIDNVGNGVLFWMESTVTIQDCNIAKNLLYDNVLDDSSGIIMLWSTVKSFRNDFRDQHGGSGAFFYAASNSTFIDENSNFSSGSSLVGGVGYLLSSSANIQGSNIENMAVLGKAGIIYAHFSSSLTLSNTTASKIISYEVPGLIYASSSDLHISNCEFNVFTPSGIRFYGQDNHFTMTNSSIFDGGSEDDINGGDVFGGALYVSSTVSFSATNNTFENLRARQGGAFYFDEQNLDIFIISNNIFKNWSARQGGAIYNVQQMMNVNENQFINNTASNLVFRREVVVYGDGGAVYDDCPWDHAYSKHCISNFTRNLFSGNVADHDGGALKISGQEPYFHENIFDDNNYALYGGKIAMQPAALKLVSFVNGRMLSDTENGIKDVASGQNVPHEVCIGIYDDFDFLVSTEQDASWQLLPVNSNTTSISGSTRINARKGVFCYDAIQIVAQPGSNIKISAVSSLFQDRETGEAKDNIYLEIDVQLRECVSGESLINGQCFVCMAGTYSLDPSSTQCSKCPNEAECYGGNLIAPKKGYWRPHNSTDKFFTCPFANACLGGEEDLGVIWETGRWETGYEGNQCQSWSDEYSRVGKNEWYKWASLEENIVILTMIVVFMILVITLMVKSTLTSANKPKALHSIYIRIFVNYLQVIMLMISFDLQWPSFVYEFLSYQETAGSVTGQIYFLDCSTPSVVDLHPYYAKGILIIILPIIVIILSCTFWGAAAIIKRRPDYLQRQLVSTILIVLFFIHPVVVKTIFALFSWTEIEDGEFWIVEQQDIQCWDSQHIWYIYRLFVPALIVWGFCFPFISLALLIRNRRRLHSKEVRLKYGYLFMGYSIHSFYWEFVIISRKILIAFISVFFASVSAAVQGLLAFCVLNIWLLLQVTQKPYTHSSLNRLETFAIITACTTIYWGLFYLSEAIGYTASLWLFFFILLNNWIFMFYWIKCMLQNFVFKFMQLFMIRKLKSDAKNQTLETYDKVVPNYSVEIEDDSPCSKTPTEIEARPPTPNLTM